MRTILQFAVAAYLLLAAGAAAQESDDRHSGYYYPPPQSEETFESKVEALPGVNRKSRIGLVSGMAKRQLERNFDAGYHMFAKGTEAQKLIIVATQDGRYDTLFRLRALLAALSSEARFSPLFQSSGAPEYLTFLDLLKLGGFTQVTLSNGRDISHQIFIR